MTLADMSPPDTPPRASTTLAPAADFVLRHVGPTEGEQAEMLALLGYESLEDLISAAVPEAIRDTDSLSLPPGRGEAETQQQLRVLANRNQRLVSKLGMGYHDTITTPAVIRRYVLESPAWYTSYTPYQPEISQGRLEVPVGLPDDDL